MREERSHNKFDSYIKQELEQLTPDIKMGSWDKLSQRLDAAEQVDSFDKEVSSHLKGIHVPYQKSSWSILAERLTLERDRFQAIVHYKAMEISLLVLLLITFWLHAPLQTNTIQKTPPSYPIASIELNKNKGITKTYTHEVDQNVLAINASTPTLIENTNASSIKEKEPQKNNTKLTSSESTSNILHLSIDKQAPNATPLNPLPSLNAIGINTTYDAQAQLKKHQAAKTTNLSSPTDAFRHDGALATLDSKELSLLDYGEAEDLLGYIRPSNRKTFFRIGFFGSPDYNHVITPLQGIGNGTVAAFDSYALSYSGGITLGIEHGKWEIEVGAIYEARNYQAIPTVYISGNTTEGYIALSLRDIELNTMNLPLRFRYNYIMHDKWRFYALAGASLNVVLSANYYTVESEIPNISTPHPSRTGTSRVTKPPALRNKNLIDGLLEGGGFIENMTLYANFGLGIERYMSYRWSIFAQPTAQFALPIFNKGLGPYNDRIDNLGVNIGLKVRL